VWNLIPLDIKKLSKQAFKIKLKNILFNCMHKLNFGKLQLTVQHEYFGHIVFYSIVRHYRLY